MAWPRIQQDVRSHINVRESLSRVAAFVKAEAPRGVMEILEHCRGDKMVETIVKQEDPSIGEVAVVEWSAHGKINARRKDCGGQLLWAEGPRMLTYLVGSVFLTYM